MIVQAQKNVLYGKKSAKKLIFGHATICIINSSHKHHYGGPASSVFNTNTIVCIKIQPPMPQYWST